jgi:hypothetical protein
MIKLELTVDEANTILRVLGKHPFEEVVTLISNIKAQGEPQVAAMEAAAANLPDAPAEAAKT